MTPPVDQLALAAVEPIESGMLVGLGTGRAATRGVHALADRVNTERLEIRCVTTSVATEALAQELGLPVDPIQAHPSIDYLFDGADEFDDRMRMLKGGGGAMTREKMVAQRARRRVYLVQESKHVERLGQHFPLPVEVRESSLDSVRAALAERGMQAAVRAAAHGPYITDNGNPILDVTLDAFFDPEELALWLDRRRGVVGHGLFLNEADEIIVENETGAIRRLFHDG